jgi:hypothetical protein
MTEAQHAQVRRGDLERTAVERARDAIKAGRSDDALAALDDVLAEAKPVHDLYGDMVASLLSFIGERFGDQGVIDATRHLGEDLWHPVIEAFRNQTDTVGLAEVVASFLKAHRYTFEAWEDDEKWAFAVQHCTSGERMVREGKVMGIGAGGPGRFGTVANTFRWADDSVDRLPQYDVHWMFMCELPEEYGWPVLDVWYGMRADGVPAVKEISVLKRPRKDNLSLEE